MGPKRVAGRTQQRNGTAQCLHSGVQGVGGGTRAGRGTTCFSRGLRPPSPSSATFACKPGISAGPLKPSRRQEVRRGFRKRAWLGAAALLWRGLIRTYCIGDLTVGRECVLWGVCAPDSPTWGLAGLLRRLAAIQLVSAQGNSGQKGGGRNWACKDPAQPGPGRYPPSCPQTSPAADPPALMWAGEVPSVGAPSAAKGVPTRRATEQLRATGPGLGVADHEAGLLAPLGAPEPPVPQGHSPPPSVHPPPGDFNAPCSWWSFPQAQA